VDQDALRLSGPGCAAQYLAHCTVKVEQNFYSGGGHDLKFQRSAILDSLPDSTVLSTRLYIGYISAISRRYLGYISAILDSLPDSTVLSTVGQLFGLCHDTAFLMWQVLSSVGQLFGLFSGLANEPGVPPADTLLYVKQSEYVWRT
jgi:hypothetical protein